MVSHAITGLLYIVNFVNTDVKKALVFNYHLYKMKIGFLIQGSY